MASVLHVIETLEITFTIEKLPAERLEEAW